MKEVLLAVPEIKEIIAQKKRDSRIEKIVSKYYGVRSLPEEPKVNELEEIIKARILETKSFTSDNLKRASGPCFSTMVQRPPMPLNKYFAPLPMRMLKYFKYLK